ncbi:conserved repeat domain-containing protein [Arthrobacter alpinus]|uniref:Conserved repeat domain-containing protein n=1 Tax=Arthrobacter alpinus TaxID=656366 RepID=A0A1H5PF88_9MICC|nr:hypothetical protein [Arthrobacter alpinus]SEF12593.1 conserved repeat domain-containing protein [Arthrobacter alpinus]
MLSHSSQEDPTQCPLATFSQTGSSDEVQGIHFIHSVDKAVANAGEILTFTTWILNATSKTLANVCLHPLSFTNEHMEALRYSTEPPREHRNGRVLGPHGALTYAFTYLVAERDIHQSGFIISALQAKLTAPGLGTLRSECDAIISTTLPRFSLAFPSSAVEPRSMTVFFKESGQPIDNTMRRQ